MDGWVKEERGEVSDPFLLRFFTGPKSGLETISSFEEVGYFLSALIARKLSFACAFLFLALEFALLIIACFDDVIGGLLLRPDCALFTPPDDYFFLPMLSMEDSLSFECYFFYLEVSLTGTFIIEERAETGLILLLLLIVPAF